MPGDTFPNINNGLAPFNTGTAGQRDSSTWQFFDMLTWVKGSHTLKLGTDIRHQQALNLQRQQPSGNFNFPAGLTGNPQSQAGTGLGLRHVPARRGGFRVGHDPPGRGPHGLVG